MKKENTASRLNKIMVERNLRQVDILQRVKPLCIKYDIKMNKSDISQYVSGKVEPSQEKLVILGMALNVSEAWLMGFDVPMQRESDAQLWDREAKQYEDHINAFYYQMKSLGWTYEWLDDENLYRFSNGTAFFKISNEMYSELLESSQQFCKEQLEKLYDEYHEQTKVLLFAKNNSTYVNAAHADDYANAPEELKQLEEDIMDDENF